MATPPHETNNDTQTTLLLMKHIIGLLQCQTQPLILPSHPFLYPSVCAHVPLTESMGGELARKQQESAFHACCRINGVCTTQMLTHTPTGIDVRMNTRTHMYVHTHTHVHMYVSACVHVGTCAWVLRTCV